MSALACTSVFDPAVIGPLSALLGACARLLVDERDRRKRQRGERRTRAGDRGDR